MKAFITTLSLIIITVSTSYSQDVSSWFSGEGQYYSTDLLIQKKAYHYQFLYQEKGVFFLNKIDTPSRPDASSKTDLKFSFTSFHQKFSDAHGLCKIEGDNNTYEYKFVVRNEIKLFAFKQTDSTDWNVFIWDKY